MRPIRSILGLGLMVALALPGGASAQTTARAGRAAAIGPNAQDNSISGAPVSGETIPAAPPSGIMGHDGQAPVAGRQKAPRSEKAIGPDLAAYLFAPIGAIVTPIARDLHGVDAALAPVNEAMKPLTDPVDPNLFQLSGQAAPAAGAPEPVQPAAAAARPATPSSRK